MGEKPSDQARLNRKALLIAISVFAGWALVVGLSGLGIKLVPGGWNFALTGQLGDSFGVIGAAMASVAAYFAFQTYTLQHEETRLLRQERQEAAKLRAEPSFLNLLERRYDALRQFSYHGRTGPLSGVAAIDRMMFDIGQLVRQSVSPLEAYRRCLPAADNYGHLFRFTYHIVRYAERAFDGASDDSKAVTRKNLSYRYVSLLRSQLTDGELSLLALNVLMPEGSGAKRLYERYALFHNLSEDRKKLVQAAGDWDERAFGLPPEPGKPIV